MNPLYWLNLPIIIIILLSIYYKWHKKRKYFNVYMWIAILIAQIIDYIYYHDPLVVYIILWLYSLFAIKTSIKHGIS